jgi:hypothetical protein
MKWALRLGLCVCAEVARAQLITIANDNGSTLERINLLAKSYEYEWVSCIYFLKQVISCVIKIPTGQVQLRGLRSTSAGCFKIISWNLQGNNFIQDSS